MMLKRSLDSSKTELNFLRATVFRKRMRKKLTWRTSTNRKNRKRESSISC